MNDQISTQDRVIQMAQSKYTLHVLLAYAAIYFVWGSTYLAIRYAVESIPPFLMMGIRHLTAGLLLYGWLRFRGTLAPSRRLWFPALVAGFLLFLAGHGVLAWAEQRIDSGLCAMLLATEPLIMVFAARISGQERAVSRRTWIGLLLGIIGVGLLFSIQTAHSYMLGVTAALVSATMWPIGAIYARGIRNTGSIRMFSAQQMIGGGGLLLGSGLALGERLHVSAVSLRSLAALGYLVVFGSIVAFSAYTWLLRVDSSARVSTHAYVNPVIAIFLGWALAGEPITARVLVGSAIILAGVMMVNYKESQREPEGVDTSRRGGL